MAEKVQAAEESMEEKWQDQQDIAEETAVTEASPLLKRNFENPLRGGWPGMQAYLEDNKKVVTYFGGGILAVILAILGYRYFILAPQEEEAREALYQNQRWFEADSFNIALRGSSTYPGMQELADDYSSTKAGNLARYYTGMALLQQGKYEDAIDYLKNFDTESDLIQALAFGGIGDCYAQLKQYDEAAEYYSKAARASGDQYTVPHYNFKAGLAYERSKDYSAALDSYKAIKEKFPKSREAMEIDKYIGRAEAAAQAK